MAVAAIFDFFVFCFAVARTNPLNPRPRPRAPQETWRAPQQLPEFCAAAAASLAGTLLAPQLRLRAATAAPVLDALPEPSRTAHKRLTCAMGHSNESAVAVTSNKQVALPPRIALR